MDLKEIMDNYNQFLTEKYKLDILEDCLYRIEDDISKIVDSGNYKYDYSYTDLLIRSVSKSILVFREVIVLCKNGLPDGALSLSRNLFEQFAIITRFELCADIFQRDEIVKRYFEDYELKLAKFMKHISEYSEKRTEGKRYQKLYDEIKRKYSLRRVSEYWWCDSTTFSELVEYIIKNTDSDLAQMIINMHILYKAACNSLHGGSLGNTHIIGEGFKGVDLHPQTSGQEVALDLSIKSFIMIVTSIYKQMGLDYKDVNSQLNELGVFYHIFSTGK